MEKLQAAPEAKAQPSERRVSETDPEARLMKESNGWSFYVSRAATVARIRPQA
jgi:hypothetical protein